MNYKHRELTIDEQQKFKDLYDHIIINNRFMSYFYKDQRVALIFPIIIVGLSIGTIQLTQSIYLKIIGFICGLLAIQLNFITSHLWAHALMLEYEMWTIDEMIKKVGYIGSVIQHAFYHHHNKDKWWNNLPSDKIFGNSDKNMQYRCTSGNIAVAVAHWESFSLFTSNFPFQTIKIFISLAILKFPTIIPFILGYEFGVILLPISHDWVHFRHAAIGKFYYVLKTLELLGIFATRDDHKSHHVYDHPTVYKGFTSSGIYSKRFDSLIDAVWDYTFVYSNKNCVEMHKILWYLMILTLWGSILFASLMCYIFN